MIKRKQLSNLFIFVLSVVTSSASVPHVGLSARTWNSGVFDQNGDTASVSAFGAWRGQPVDQIMFYSYRDSWDNMKIIPTDITSFPGIKIISVPPFSESLGNAGLAQTAAGEFNAWWTAYGQSLVSKGLNNNRTVIRIGWEFNGTWFAWSATTGQYNDFINAFRNVVTSIRAGGANAVQFDWCVNKGNQGNTDAWACYPGDAYVDILGLDIYDFWDPSFSDADFASQAAHVPSLDDVAAYCRAHKKQMAIDEWGVAHDDHGGNDNPFFIQKMWDWLTANSSIIAYDSYFDDVGAGLNHELSPDLGGSTWNPNSAALYKALWGAGKPTTVPAAPTNLTAVAGNTQVTLNWNATGLASSYNVYLNLFPHFPFPLEIAKGVTETSYTNTHLFNGIRYYYTVRAVDVVGVSKSSNEVGALPADRHNTHSGTWSAKGIIPTTPSYISLFQVASATQNTTYVASVWVKGSGNFIIKTLDGNWTGITESTFAVSPVWTKRSVTFTTPNTADPSVVFYIAEAGGNGTLFIDDVFMGVQGGANVLSNPGFENGDSDWDANAPVWSIQHNP